MSKSFLQRRLQKSPDYELEAWITGVSMPDGHVQWNVEIDGTEDCDLAAGILQRGAEVLWDCDSQLRAFNMDVFDA